MENESQTKKLTMSNTKKEMLAAYNALATQLKEKRQLELDPEKRVEERQAARAVEVTEELSAEGVLQQVGHLKSEIGRILSELSDRLEEGVGSYNAVKEAITAKNTELREIYEIERSAVSLAALIEAQNQKKLQFETEASQRRKQVEEELQEIRLRYDNEKQQLVADVEEVKAAEKKRREREKEEYQYAFEREKRMARDQFEDERARLERDLELQKEEMDRKAKVLATQEVELHELREKVEAFPRQMEEAVTQATLRAEEKSQAEARRSQELLTKEFEGERNVLKTRLQSLEQTIQEYGTQLSQLSKQLQRSYEQVEGIALKAVESSSNIKSLASLQQWAERVSKEPPTK